MISVEELLKEAKASNDAGNNRAVIDLLPEALLETYHNIDLYAEKARACYMLDEDDQLSDIVEKILSIDPQHLLGNYYKGYVYSKLGQYPEAILFYNKTIELDPNFVQAYYGLGRLYEDLDQNEKAIGAYSKAVEVNPNYSYAYNGLGNIYKKLKQYPDALRSYEKAIGINPKFVEAYYNLGSLYDDLRQNEKAIEAYDKAIEVNPNYSDAYNSLGIIYKRLKQYPEAIKAYNNAIKINPEFSYPFNGLGNVYIELKQYPEAIKAYEKAIEIDPKYSQPYNGLGNVYYELAQYPEAIKAFNRSIEADPNILNPYNGLGLTFQALKQYPEAIKVYTKAIKTDPQNDTPYYNRATSYFYSNQYEKSLADYIKYVDLTQENPDNYTLEAKDKIAEINKLINNPEYTAIRELINKIKKLLLFNDHCITHYTGFTVAKLLILEGSLLRLSEGTYLNDTSEGRELFKYLSFQATSNIATVKGTLAEPFAKKPFIGSFVAESKHDDLTLWRMYGKEAKEEAKGCAITLVRDEFLKNIQQKLNPLSNSDTSSKTDEEFSFYRVAYRKENEEKQFIIPSSEEAEDELNKYMTDLAGKVKEFRDNHGNDIPNMQNLLESLNEIAYLFKSAEYQYENELRLVIKGIFFEKKFSPDTPPRVYIELINIKPIIKKITLGPKVEKSDEWAAAFYYNLDKEGYNPEILISHLPFK